MRKKTKHRILIGLIASAAVVGVAWRLGQESAPKVQAAGEAKLEAESARAVQEARDLLVKLPPPPQANREPSTVPAEVGGKSDR
jgi:type III secretion system FlhB-like substrate exporter